MNNLTFRHKAVYGITGTGKTWFLKRQATQLLRNKQKVLVWTGTGESGWPRGCRVTCSVDELESWLSNPANFGAYVMLDEGAILFEETAKRKDYPAIHSLFLSGRHKGFTCYIATQQPTTIPKRVRFNCGDCFCFGLGDEDSAQLVWKDYNRLNVDGVPAWKIILKQKKLHFVHFRAPEQIKQMRL